MEQEKTFQVEIDGKTIVAYENIRGEQLKKGDLYIAKRNTGWQLGKCGRVMLGPNEKWVESDPPCAIYSYDCWECRKVKEILD